MSLPADEFLRRFLLHLLPRGFVRIRNFGFLANRRRAQLLPICFERLHGSAAHVSSATRERRSSSWRCPMCEATMLVIDRLSAADLLLRSPPPLAKCAA
jgi:putative transposase